MKQKLKISIPYELAKDVVPLLEKLNAFSKDDWEDIRNALVFYKHDLSETDSGDIDEIINKVDSLIETLDKVNS